VGHDRGQLADARQRLPLLQELLESLGLGEVTDDAGELAHPVDVGLAHRQVQRELGLVAAFPAYLPADADHFAVTGAQIALQVGIVVLGVGRGHQHADVLPHDLPGLVAEHPQRRLIGPLHAPALIDHDHAVDDGLDHGPVQSLDLEQFVGLHRELACQLVARPRQFRRGPRVRGDVPAFGHQIGRRVGTDPHWAKREVHDGETAFGRPVGGFERRRFALGAGGDGGTQTRALCLVVGPPRRVPEQPIEDIALGDPRKPHGRLVHFEHAAIRREQADESKGAVHHRLDPLLPDPQCRQGLGRQGTRIGFRLLQAVALDEQREARRDEFDDGAVFGREGRRGHAAEFQRANPLVTHRETHEERVGEVLFHERRQGRGLRGDHEPHGTGRAAHGGVDDGVGNIADDQEAVRRLDQVAEPRQQRVAEVLVGRGRDRVGSEGDGRCQPGGIEMTDMRHRHGAAEVYLRRRPIDSPRNILAS